MWASGALRRVFLNSRCTSLSHRAAVKACATAAAEVASPPSLETPAPEGAPKQYPAHITTIVDQISKLTLLEVADLSDCLKTTLKIQDAPMMAMGVPAAAGAAPSEQEAEDSRPQVEKAEFKVILSKFDESKKVALIKEVKKHIDGMNLVQAKKFVEACPQAVKSGVGKEEAEALKKALEEAGGTVEID